jgi:transcription elongation GreA/GreB family factor
MHRGAFYQISTVNKSDLRAAILQQLRDELALQLRAAQLARDEATDEESRARSKYDTHSQEAAYLAQGQARLAAEVEKSLESYTALPLADFAPTDAIALGALVELEVGAGKRNWYFVGPRAGGLEVPFGDGTMLVVTPQSPLGRQLLGRHAGDVVPGSGNAPAAQRIASVR